MTHSDWINENLVNYLPKCGQEIGKASLILPLLGAGSCGTLTSPG